MITISNLNEGFNTIDGTRLLNEFANKVDQLIDAKIAYQKKKKKPNVKMIFNGKEIVVGNNKNVWSGTGPAKLAFWNWLQWDLEKIVEKFKDPQFTKPNSYNGVYTDVPKEMKKWIIDKLVELGILEFKVI